MCHDIIIKYLWNLDTQKDPIQVDSYAYFVCIVGYLDLDAGLHTVFLGFFGDYYLPSPSLLFTFGNK